MNDLYYFAQVVEHGGFAAASRALGVPKSKLSRRVAFLEDRLGVRLIQRSTRKFSVTDTGQAYHRHCLAMVAEAEAAQDVIDRTRAEPQGTVRITCPVLLASGRLSHIIGRFMAENPRVSIHMQATNRRVDVIEEGIDIAIRVRMPPLEDSDLIIKQYERHAQALVAAPGFLARHPVQAPEDLDGLPSMDQIRNDGVHTWRFRAENGADRVVPYQPRLITDDLDTLRRAALESVGVAALPRLLIEDDIKAGHLTVLLPEWTMPTGIVHAVFASRRGLVPAVRRFLDHMELTFRDGCPLKPTG